MYKRQIETLGEKDIYYIFTPLMPNTSTRIILKKPKTDSSIRKVWLPKTLAYILREWKKSQDELKGFLGDEYQDFNLVVALPDVYKRQDTSSFPSVFSGLQI